jgi:Trypsin-like peptidase domain
VRLIGFVGGMYLDGSPIVGRGLYNSWIYLAVSKRLLVLHRDVRMKKLLLATVCVIALTVGAQASFRLILKQGEQIASYGFPYGADFPSFTMGHVTSVVGLDNNTSGFQMSAPVQPGNSGGPLLDMNGRVVGMAQGILGTLRAAEALGGAIPQNVNFGITATTIIGFLQAHSVDYRIDTEKTKLDPEQIAEEAKKFTVKITRDSPDEPQTGVDFCAVAAF